MAPAWLVRLDRRALFLFLALETSPAMLRLAAGSLDLGGLAQWIVA
jgi:hypothetical protein